MHFTGMSVEVGGKAGDYQGAFGVPLHMQADLESLCMWDYVAEGSAYPQVMRFGKQLDAAAPGVLHMRFEDRPACSKASYLLDVAASGGLIVYSSALATRVYRHLQVDYEVDTRALIELVSRSAASNVEQHRLLTQRMIQQAVEHRLPFDIQLDVKLPDIVIPETVCASALSKTSALVYQMGRIAANCQVSSAIARCPRVHAPSCRAPCRWKPPPWHRACAGALSCSQREPDRSAPTTLLSMPMQRLWREGISLQPKALWARRACGASS